MLGSKKTTNTTVSVSSGSTTLVSRDTAIKGDVHFSGNLEIEGLIQGNIVAEPGKDAIVHAEARDNIGRFERVKSVDDRDFRSDRPAVRDRRQKAPIAVEGKWVC